MYNACLIAFLVIIVQPAINVIHHTFEMQLHPVVNTQHKLTVLQDNIIIPVFGLVKIVPMQFGSVNSALIVQIVLNVNPVN